MKIEISESKTECPDCFNIGLANQEEELLDLEATGIPSADLLKMLILTGPDDTNIDFNGISLLTTNSSLFDITYINNFGYPFDMTVSANHSILHIDKGKAYILHEGNDTIKSRAAGNSAME